MVINEDKHLATDAPLGTYGHLDGKAGGNRVRSGVVIDWFGVRIDNY